MSLTDVCGIIAILVLVAFGCYGVCFEVKHMKACADKERAQTRMYEEILEQLRKRGN